MKTIKYVKIGVAVMLTNLLNAQTVNYTVLSDNPEKYIPRLNLNVDLFQMDGSFYNIEGLSFNTGVWGNYMIQERLGVSASINKSLFTFGRLGNKDFRGNFEVQAGALFLPLKSVKKKDITVVLSQKESQSLTTNERITTTRSIKVPGQVIKYKGFRAGLINKSVGFDLYDLNKKFNAPTGSYNYYSMAIYGGIMSRKLKSIKVEVEGEGTRGTSAGDELFVDATFNAVSMWDGDPTLSKNIKTAVNHLPFGFRVGWNRYQIAPKSETGKRFGGSGHFELGWRPYQGWYIAGSISLTIIKKPIK